VVNVHDKKTGEVKHTRNIKVMQLRDPCECKFSYHDYPTSSLELNPAENTQNQLQQVVQTVLKETQSSGLEMHATR
jgi:hypothetical protein